MSGILNLQKNDVLDLTKKDPSLNNLMVGAGWDVIKKGLFSFAQADYDLDLVAYLLDANDKLLDGKAVIYYGDMAAQGIRLHGDNRTGAGDGDDEKITVSLSSLPSNCKKVVFTAIIYDAQKRRQTFEKVQNAYVRLVDVDKRNGEVCRFNLTENGGDNTAIIFAELMNTNGNWSFKAVGKYLQASVGSLAQMFK